MCSNWKLKVDILQEGPNTLPWCNHYYMHMPVAQLVKHRRTGRCNKATEMCLRRGDVDMAERCG